MSKSEAIVMANQKNILLLWVLLLGSVLVLGACSNTSDESVMAGDMEISDPFEDTNRVVFQFNNAVDDALFHPIVKGYRTVFPKFVRNGVHNFLINLKSPVTFANQILQGDLHGAGDVLVRASVNTLTGFGGLLDVAAAEGIPYESEDFGQTLAVWGVDHGPYLVVPLIGPSSTRDYIGFFVDGFFDPLRFYLFNIEEEGIFYAKTAVQYLDLRDQLMDVLEELEASSIDYYAATRAIYYQRRAALVKDADGDVMTAPVIPDFDEYDDE